MFTIVKLIIYTNLWLASAAGLLAYAIAKQIGSASLAYFGFASGAVLFIYNVHQLFRIRELDVVASNRHKWAKKHLSVIALLAVVGLSLALVSFISSFMTVLGGVFILLFGVISILYSYRVHPSMKTLRELPYLKIHFIALTWTASTAVFPLLYADSYESNYYLLVLGIYFYFLAITIPFDIRDLAFDTENQKTIPQTLGIKWAIYLGQTLLLIAGLLFILYKHSFAFHPIFYIAFIYAFIGIALAKKPQSELFFVGGIDGGIILLALSFT